MIYACTTFGLFVFFPWGIPQLQSDWSLSCDHGLDYARTTKTTRRRVIVLRMDYVIFFYFSHTFTFQLLDKPWSYAVVEWITRGHVSSVCTFDLFTCAPFSVSCVLRRESVVFPGRILISLDFSDLPRAPAPLCDHGL